MRHREINKMEEKLNCSNQICPNALFLKSKQEWKSFYKETKILIFFDKCTLLSSRFWHQKMHEQLM